MTQLRQLPEVTNFARPVVRGRLKGKGYIPADGAENTRRWKEFERKVRDMDGVTVLPFEAAADRGLTVIQESGWNDYLEEAIKEEATNRHLWDALMCAVLDQKTTNYCWIFAVATIMMTMRMQSGEGVIRPSPASAGGPITGFQNVGGWSSNGLEYVVEKGMNDESEWPPTAISRTYYTEENKQLALKNKAIEVFYCNPSDKKQRWLETGTALSAGFAVAAGYNHWSHAIGLLQMNLAHDVDLANSWGSGWGDNGHGRLTKSSGKAQPDDACLIWTMATR